MLDIQIFTFSPVQENTYILVNEQKEGIIIDPGCYEDEEKEALAGFLSENGIRPKLLLQTHAHLDHVFGTKWVNETYGLIPHLHRDEEPLMQQAPTHGLMWNLPFDGYQGPLVYLEDGSRLQMGNDELESLLVPGHSPGHLCFYLPGQGVLIGGDALFKESIGRTDLPGGNHAQLLKGIREKLFTLPDETVVYPGHGSSTTIGHEKRHNPWLK
jgi:hydroxyacylglutathione hydrolase